MQLSLYFEEHQQRRLLRLKPSTYVAHIPRHTDIEYHFGCAIYISGTSWLSPCRTLEQQNVQDGDQIMVCLSYTVYLHAQDLPVIPVSCASCLTASMFRRQLSRVLDLSGCDILFAGRIWPSAATAGELHCGANSIIHLRGRASLKHYEYSEDCIRFMRLPSMSEKEIRFREDLIGSSFLRRVVYVRGVAPWLVPLELDVEHGEDTVIIFLDLFYGAAGVNVRPVVDRVRGGTWDRCASIYPNSLVRLDVAPEDFLSGCHMDMTDIGSDYI